MGWPYHPFSMPWRPHFFVDGSSALDSKGFLAKGHTLGTWRSKFGRWGCKLKQKKTCRSRIWGQKYFKSPISPTLSTRNSQPATPLRQGNTIVEAVRPPLRCKASPWGHSVEFGIPRDPHGTWWDCLRLLVSMRWFFPWWFYGGLMLI